MLGKGCHSWLPSPSQLIDVHFGLAIKYQLPQSLPSIIKLMCGAPDLECMTIYPCCHWSWPPKFSPQCPWNWMWQGFVINIHSSFFPDPMIQIMIIFLNHLCNPWIITFWSIQHNIILLLIWRFFLPYLKCLSQILQLISIIKCLIIDDMKSINLKPCLPVPYILWLLYP